MDPKMDSGCAVPEKDATMDQFDPLMYTLPEEIIGLMDQMLCYEVYTWSHKPEPSVTDHGTGGMAFRKSVVTNTLHLITPECTPVV